jgi:hypothetical protein
MTRKPILYTALLLVLTCRAVIAFIGYDRVPIVSSSDEIYWADVAMSLAEGKGYVAPSFPGTRIALDRLYTHHPPVYVLLLAGSIKIFGLSILTLRGWGIVSHLAAIVLLIYILHCLWRRNLIDAIAAISVAALLLSDCSTLSVARWGRSDPLATLLAVAALALLAQPAEPSGKSLTRWAAASALLGLSLATHPVTAPYYLMFVFLMLTCRRDASPHWALAILLACLPSAIFATLWLLTYGSDSLVALSQFREITRVQGGGFTWRRWLEAVSSGDAREFLQAGATTTVAVFLSWLLVAIRWSQVIVRTSWEEATRWFSALGLAALSQLVMIQMLSGIQIKRVYVFFPLAALSIGCALYDWQPKLLRRVALAAVCAMVIGGLLQIGVYVRNLSSEWASRDPRIPESVLRRLPHSAKFAVAPRLWYYCRKEQLNFRVIDFGFEPSIDYWRQPGILDAFDIVILPADHRLVEEHAVHGVLSQTFRFGGEEFKVFLKHARSASVGGGQ